MYVQQIKNKFIYVSFLFLQAELSGDQAAVQVLEAAEAQIAGELSQELEKLAEKQIDEQAALEVKQAEELINMEKELQAEQQGAGNQVADQIEEQKQKVGNAYTNSPIPPPLALYPLSILPLPLNPQLFPALKVLLEDVHYYTDISFVSPLRLLSL